MGAVVATTYPKLSIIEPQPHCVSIITVWYIYIHLLYMLISVTVCANEYRADPLHVTCNNNNNVMIFLISIINYVKHVD